MESEISEAIVEFSNLSAVDTPELTPDLIDGSNEEYEPIKYGELFVLGYNGMENHILRDKTGPKKHSSKLEICQRKKGNGIAKAKSYSVSAPSHSQAIQDKSRHAVSYTYNRNQTVIVEYQNNTKSDMFQIGRSSETQIDFTVVDTWLAAGTSEEHLSSSQKSRPPDRPAPTPPYSSTISRYACRILIDRDPPFTARVYAAGFDSSRNIFLGEKAAKWQKKNGEVDGLTTNGILILHPVNASESNSSNGFQSPMYEWREVSVDGDIYTLRESRSAPKRGDLVREETNVLQDGTLIDLCGATLLWRTKEGLDRTPNKDELEGRLDELNEGRPQCPVNFNTLIIPKRKGSRKSIPGVESRRESNGTGSLMSGGNGDHEPYVYTLCGHVQGKHDWGHVVGDEGSGHPKHRCPICSRESDRIIQLSMGMEPAFHIDSEALDHAFIPCGHLASLNTVKYWSRIPLPHGTNSFHPVCPFCTVLLSREPAWIRLIFQDFVDG